MGSNRNRRRSDRVTIKLQGQHESMGSAGKKDGGKLNCPLTFSVPLAKEYSKQSGASLHLKREGTNLAVYLRSTKLKLLGTARSEQIIGCQQKGYEYFGVIKNTRNGNVYGEFRRTS